MKKPILLILTMFLFCNCLFAETNVLWQAVDKNNVSSQGKQSLSPSQYLVYALNNTQIASFLRVLAYDADHAQQVSLPMPDGSFRTFAIWQTHIMQPQLEAKYTSIKTFTAYAVDDPRVTAKIDLGPRGFHAMIFNGSRTSFIDPYSDINDGYYICYYKKDYTRTDGVYMTCAVDDNTRMNSPAYATNSSTATMRLVNGNVSRTYRLAIACTGEYAQAVAGTTPTKANVLNAIVTTINRVNGVYERELAITMQLVNNEDTLIFLTPGAYSNSDIFALVAQNQDTIDRRIGTKNYDLGHVFSTGGGGFSQLGCACIGLQKAQSESGALSPTGDAYDIDYVAHEIGHEFDANHSFNDNSNGACSGNASYYQAYEPGGGSTIMCYAGICDGDNLQQHSDAYFHAVSLGEINDFITNVIPTCPAVINSGNKPVEVPSFSKQYYIPYLTPFELIAPVVADSVADTLKTYCWEEWDRGDFGASFANTHNTGPIFRSFFPDTSRTRVFPKLVAIVNDTPNYLGEKMPEVARALQFKLTVRDIYHGMGCVNIPDDSILLNVVNTGKPFKVTNPNTVAITWKLKSTAIITWDVANTNATPISCDSVDVYLSADGGYTYPYFLTRTINNGTVNVAVPNIVTSKARIKIKGANNVFFDISNENFSIDSIVQNANDITLYPVPAGRISGYKLFVKIKSTDLFEFAVYNMLGQSKLHEQATEQLIIDLNNWSAGVYLMRLKNTHTGESFLRRFVVE